jgi:hypothetical protein
LNNILALFAPDPYMVFIDSREDDKCIGLAVVKAEFERAFTQSEGASLEYGLYSVSAAGLVA